MSCRSKSDRHGGSNKKKKEKRREMSRGEDGGRGRRTVDVGRSVGIGAGLGDSSRVG